MFCEQILIPNSKICKSEHILKILTTTITVPPIYSYKIFLKSERENFVKSINRDVKGLNKVSVFMTTFKIRSSSRYRTG